MVAVTEKQAKAINEAIATLHCGGIIAYPTEGVYGLGCDPFNKQAVYTLCAIKARSIDKGLILIAAEWAQLQHLILPISAKRLSVVQASWPGPITWVFPASSHAPRWICGKHASIALRITQHAMARTLCEQFGAPIVSTSANLHKALPARHVETVIQYFGRKVDTLIDAPLGQLTGPTLVRDALTGKILRPL